METDEIPPPPSIRIILPILGLVVIAVAVFGLIPRPVVFPKDPPAAEREANRRLTFAGATNFRDLGGYQTAAFTTIDQKYGSFDQYLHTGLGLTGQDIQKLRGLLLEP